MLFHSQSLTGRKPPHSLTKHRIWRLVSRFLPEFSCLRRRQRNRSHSDHLCSTSLLGIDKQTYFSLAWLSDGTRTLLEYMLAQSTHSQPRAQPVNPSRSQAENRHHSDSRSVSYHWVDHSDEPRPHAGHPLRRYCAATPLKHGQVSGAHVARCLKQWARRTALTATDNSGNMKRIILVTADILATLKTNKTMKMRFSAMPEERQ